MCQAPLSYVVLLPPPLLLLYPVCSGTGVDMEGVTRVATEVDTADLHAEDVVGGGWVVCVGKVIVGAAP